MNFSLTQFSKLILFKMFNFPHVISQGFRFQFIYIVAILTPVLEDTAFTPIYINHHYFIYDYISATALPQIFLWAYLWPNTRIKEMIGMQLPDYTTDASVTAATEWKLAL